MATVEKDVLFQKGQDLLYPITKTDNILDLEDYMYGYRYYKHFGFINQVYDLSQYTFETTFLDIIKSMKERSILRYETTTSDVPNVNYLCTNELYSITGSYYNLVEIIRHTTSSETIKIYDRDASNDTWKGMYIASARSKDNLISDFTFIGKTAWKDLTLLNGWKRYNDFFPTLQYRRENDRIYLRGLVKRTAETTPSSNTIIAKVPTQTFPKYTTLNSQVINYNKNNISTETSVRVDISNKGEIIIDPNGNQSLIIVGWLSLDNVSWSIGE